MRRLLRSERHSVTYEMYLLRDSDGIGYLNCGNRRLPGLQRLGVDAT